MIIIMMGLALLVCLVCAILIIIKQFQDASAVNGIIGIVTCGIWAFIWGWINVGKLDLRNIMIAWTLAVLANILLNLWFGAAMMPAFR